MEYVIYDMEWNRFSKQVKADCPDEIIQIGAVKYDENLTKIGDFSMMVKPSFYKRIEPTVERMTGISLERLQNYGKPFSTVFKEFRKFIGHNGAVLMSWGMQDASILKNNCTYYNREIGLSWLARYADLQKYVSKLLVNDENRLGLSNAADMLELSYDADELHDAYADAELSGRIFEKLFDKTELGRYIFDATQIRESLASIHITDLENEIIDKSEFEAVCPLCEKMAKRKTDYYLCDKRFIAFFRCNSCNLDIFNSVEVLQTFDNQTKYKKKVRIIKKQII